MNFLFIPKVHISSTPFRNIRFPYCATSRLCVFSNRTNGFTPSPDYPETPNPVPPRPYLSGFVRSTISWSLQSGSQILSPCPFPLSSLPTTLVQVQRSSSETEQIPWVQGQVREKDLEGRWFRQKQKTHETLLHTLPKRDYDLSRDVEVFMDSSSNSPF